MTHPQAEQVAALVAELHTLAADIARAGINGFGNRATDIADRLTAAIDAMRKGWQEVGAIDETGEPYLYLSTDLPRGALLYAPEKQA